MSLRRDQIESWLESVDDYDTGDWRPTKESFEWLCQLALKGLSARWRLVHSEELPHGSPVAPSSTLYAFYLAPEGAHWEYDLPDVPTPK